MIIRYAALERVNVVASGTHAVTSSGTVYNRRRVRGGSSLLFSGRRRRWTTGLVRAAMSGCRPSSRSGRERLWIRLGRPIVVDFCESGGLSILLSWNVSLPSLRGRVLLWTCLERSTTDDVAGRAARSSCGVGSPAVISSVTCHSRRRQRASRLASFAASGMEMVGPFGIAYGRRLLRA